MLEVIGRIKKSEYLKNVMTLMTGTAIAQFIPVLASPILSRIYSPDDFGVLALFASIVSIIAVVATARYELAIVLPREETDAKNILTLSFLITIIISLLTFVAFAFFKGSLISILHAERVSSWLYLVPVTVLLMGLFQALNYWSTRNKTFKRNSAGRVTQSTIMVVINLVLGLKKIGPAGLIIGQVVGQFASVIILSWNILKRIRIFFAQVTWAGIKENMRKYKNFAFINTPHAFIDSMQVNGIIFLITFYFSSSIVGLYFFAFRALKLPVGLVGSSMAQVFYQKASKAHHDNENIRPFVWKMYKNLFLIGLPVFLVLFITAPALFSFVFGSEWRASGEIAQIIIPWIFVNFLASPVSFIAIIANRQKKAMLITIFDISFMIISLVIGGYLENYKVALMLMTALSTILNTYVLFWYYKIADLRVCEKYV